MCFKYKCQQIGKDHTWLKLKIEEHKCVKTCKIKTHECRRRDWWVRSLKRRRSVIQPSLHACSLTLWETEQSLKLITLLVILFLLTENCCQYWRKCIYPLITLNMWDSIWSLIIRMQYHTEAYQAVLGLWETNEGKEIKLFKLYTTQSETIPCNYFLST